ncbi:hypothetical protein HJG60_008345 [Phyllostomus discolor]|uniref:Uncharacterized protein n=1 Tax=Phyllostomus discolor TaxID=89673 RepID=A0A834DSN3_9CHIR|nr:hypothetical protein HJG60_008345 [Phyllostomus discolor]
MTAPGPLGSISPGPWPPGRGLPGRCSQTACPRSGVSCSLWNKRRRNTRTASDRPGAPAALHLGGTPGRGAHLGRSRAGSGHLSPSAGKAQAPNTQEKGASWAPGLTPPHPHPPLPSPSADDPGQRATGVSQVCLSAGHLMSLSGNAVAPMKPLLPVAFRLNAPQRGSLRLICLLPGFLKGC